MDKSSKRKIFGLAIFLIAAVGFLVASFYSYNEYQQETTVIEQTAPITNYRVIDTYIVTGKRYNSYYATVLFNGHEYNSIRISPYMYRSHDFSELRVYYDKNNDDMFSEQEATIIWPLFMLCLSLFFFVAAYKAWNEKTK